MGLFVVTNKIYKAVFNVNAMVFENIYYRALYAVKQTFWRPKNVREEAIVSRLSMNGISLYELNLYLEEVKFPKYVGRYPEIIRVCPSVINIIHSAIEGFERDNRGTGFTPDERKNMLLKMISEESAREIAFSLDTFEKFRL